MNIEQLVELFEREFGRYKRSTYNESQLRTDFLDPFFKLLGWDISNDKGKRTHEREVLVEESIRESVNESFSMPDYTFRLFSERKFFLEAKKPSVNIEVDPNPARQLRTYGFSSKLKISVLSNFEYLSIYDCSTQIGNEDDVNVARVKIYHYSNYVEKFDEIKSLIGRKSVYSGEFDEVWRNIEIQLEKNNVDKLFLKQINTWRVSLGNEILQTKPDIDIILLNDIVQRYINAIIFLRVCEDRNIETYKTLLNIANTQSLESLIDKFREADTKYNSGLFSQPLNESIISDGGKAFWEIINDLYYPISNYSFVALNSDILGRVYEVFLGEYLEISNEGHVSLVKKPENVDRDIVTTPNYIVKDILNETIVNYCEGKIDEEILNSKFADIACGSGAFLLEAFQLIQDLLIDYYLSNNSDILIQTNVNTYKLPYSVKSDILQTCIYGVDKDFNAVEACKFGLLLKLLENEDVNGLGFPILPSLENNILFGNSLISRDLTDDSNVDQINPFDFDDLKFDVIIGNPPYLSTEGMRSITPLEFPIYKEVYTRSAYQQFDKYFLFIERVYELLKEDGYLGYIIPNKFAKVGSGKLVRAFFESDRCISKIISFGSHQVFNDKTTYTCILILTKNRRNESFQFHEVNSLNSWKTKSSNIIYSDILYDMLNEDSWVLITSQQRSIYNHILSRSIKLVDLVGEENIFNGIQTSKNPLYIHNFLTEDHDYYYFIVQDKEWRIEKELTRPYYKSSRGVDNLNTYRYLKPNSFVIFPYKNERGLISLVNYEELKQNYPETYKYFNHYRQDLENRSIQPEPQSENEWYRYGRHQCLDKCDVDQKIVVGVLSQGDKYAIDNEHTFISSGGTAGYCMITLPEDFKYSIYYIQALLNSKYVEWFASIYGEVFRGGYIARGTKVLKRLPIIAIDFENETQKQLHDVIADKQEQLIHLKSRMDDSFENHRVLVPLKRQFSATKIELEVLLKRLFNLGTLDDEVPNIKKIYAID